MLGDTPECHDEVTGRTRKLLRMRFIAVIPARYASTRFPGKPLALLGGKTVIERVYRRVASAVTDIVVATDDRRIHDAVTAFGGRAVMTSAEHRSGTDRVSEAVEALGGQWDVIVNVQGDEPFIRAEQITALCRCFDDEETQIATLAKPFGRSPEDIRAIENANSPKIVTSRDGYALYFSRSVIPFIRGTAMDEWPAAFPFLKHIGMYAYRQDVLTAITRLPQSALERAENLEQLRWLEYGYRIRVALTDQDTIGIDTPDDLARAEKLLAQGAV